MEQFNYNLKETTEIDAQPASVLAAKALEFRSSIRLDTDEAKVDAKKIFSIMSLPTKEGGRITVTADGIDERAAIRAMERVLVETL